MGNEARKRSAVNYALYNAVMFFVFLYTGLCYQAIKVMPFKKWLFVLLTLLPMAVYEGSSATVDPLTTGNGLFASCLYIAPCI